MRTKIVYVLTSSEKDNYAEQAFVSVSTLRRHNKDVRVALVVDDRTEKTLTGVRHKLVDMVDELVVVPMPDDMTNKVRSRMLKTTLREHVRGDYLFLDTDTLILGSIEKIDEYRNMHGSIFAVWDLHRPYSEYLWLDGLNEKFEKLGFSMDANQDYFNSGVFFVKDNEATHEFYKLWNANYLEGLKMGISTDQQSLAKTNIESGCFIYPLEDCFNVQWEFGKKFWQKAILFHYFAEMEMNNYHHFLHDPSTYRNIKEKFDIPQEYWEMMGSVEAGMDFFQAFISGIKRRKGFYSSLNKLMRKYYKFRKFI